MKGFMYYYNLFQEQEISQGDVPAGGVEDERMVAQPASDSEELINALRSIIDTAKQALEKKTGGEEDGSEDQEQDKTTGVVQRPESDGVADMFGQQDNQ